MAIKPILKSVFIFFIYYLFLNGLTLLLFSVIDLTSLTTINGQLVTISIYLLTAGIIAFFLFRRNKIETKKSIFNLRYLIITILIIILSRIIIGPIYDIIFVDNFNQSNYTNSSFLFSHSTVFVIQFALKVLIIPIIEELVFRHIILNYLRHFYSPLLAILISAILFSLNHFIPMGMDYRMVLGAFVGGISLGFIYLRYGLLLSIIGHIVFNLIWFILLILIFAEIRYEFLKMLNFNFIYWTFYVLAITAYILVIKNGLKSIKQKSS